MQACGFSCSKRNAYPSVSVMDENSVKTSRSWQLSTLYWISSCLFSLQEKKTPWNSVAQISAKTSLVLSTTRPKKPKCAHSFDLFLTSAKRRGLTKTARNETCYKLNFYRTVPTKGCHLRDTIVNFEHTRTTRGRQKTFFAESGHENSIYSPLKDCESTP